MISVFTYISTLNAFIHWPIPAYLSKVFFFPVLDQFLPIKSNFCVFCGPLAALAKIPIALVFTVYIAPISYSFMFLVPFIANSKYVFVGFSPKPAAGEKFCEFSMP